jgi:hypothetical protein|tara:strand:+ start:3068 stop:3736 length:669 start_codon:yes stop_codon:yes gene_type:complete
MKRLLIILLFVFGYGFSQTNCELCVEQNGFYCGDDPANWTQYSPNGCVPNGLNGLFYLNDGWEDCVDASDEQEAVPTTLEDCQPYAEPCDTVYVTEYETIFDTIINTEFVYEIIVDTVEVELFVPEFIYITDTLWMEGALDTLFVDVIEYVDVFVYDTIIEIEYVEFIEYVDCDTGLPCSSNLQEIIKATEGDNRMYNLLGQAIREPKGLYIQNGKVKYKIK